MKTLLALLCFSFLALAGDKLRINEQGNIYNPMGGTPVGTFDSYGDAVVTWSAYDQTNTTWGWIEDGGYYQNSSEDRWIIEVIAYDFDWNPIAWSWELWKDVPPMGLHKVAEGHMY